MYDQSQERTVFVTSLPFMHAAKAQALSMGMNDHGPLHAQRVYALVGRLCALVELSPYEIDLVRAAALLHDIGMAKDRENHHIISAQIVGELSEQGKLPFTSEESEVVSTLCAWHRREYDADAVHQGLKVRTGVLASLLRLADAMDLDYRRAEDYLRQKPVIEHIHKGQAQHHLSARSIIGVRLHAGCTGTEVQLLIDQMLYAGLQLTRLIEELVGTPVSWPVKLIPVSRSSSCGHAFQAKRHAVVFSYCNAHGVVQAGMSKRALEMTGFTTTVVCDKDRASSPVSFWQRTFPHWDFTNVQLVSILGLDLPEDMEKFLGIVRSQPRCRWIYATPLDQPYIKLAALLRAGVEVLLGDARVLFAGDALSEHAQQWTKVAGLCNADDWLTSIGSFSREEFLAARGLRFEMLKLFESGAGYKEFEDLVDRVASGELDSFMRHEAEWTKTLSSRMPAVERRGCVLILETKGMPGRFMYDLAHLSIEMQGICPWDQNEFVTPYAICRRPPTGGRERVLYLSRFSRIDNAIPVKYFVPYVKHQYGSGATIWQTYPSRMAADEAVNVTVKAINESFIMRKF